MNPLVRIEQARQDGRIPPDAYKLIVDRAHIMYSGIDRIERASGISFPVSYVEPSILVTPPDAGSFQFGVLYARTIPLILDEKLQVVIQVCAPLVSYGLRGTIHAVLAHEFLHYLELLSRISKMRLLSEVCAPLVSYGLRGTIHAVLAHEFREVALRRDHRECV